jgi:hypothetical protein
LVASPPGRPSERQTILADAAIFDPDRHAALIARHLAEHLQNRASGDGDRVSKRINWLTQHCLVELAQSNDEERAILYVDHGDGRLWERTTDHFDILKGRGAPKLTCVTDDYAKNRFGWVDPGSAARQA